MAVNIDFHVHTDLSPDGQVAINEVVTAAKRRGLHGVAVTDHNEIENALKLKESPTANDYIVIVGEEIRTSAGEITGLFLKEFIPPGLSPEETIRRIKSQGGLVVVPHPFCRLRKSKLKIQTLKQIAPLVDIIEVFNARNVFKADNRKAREFALEHKKLMVVGSDGHLAYEYGRAYVKIKSCVTAEDCKKNLSSAEFVNSSSPLWVHAVTKWRKIKKSLIAV